MRLKIVVSRIGATLFTASAMLGLFAVTGFPEPLSRQILISVGASVAVHTYMLLLDFRRHGNDS
jgi:hypothetical protein